MTADQECRSQKALDAQEGLSSLAANKLDRKEKRNRRQNSTLGLRPE